DRDGQLLHVPAGAPLLQLRLRGGGQLHPARDRQRRRDDPRPADPEGARMTRRRVVGQVLSTLAILLALAFFLLPVVWIALTSFKTQFEVFHYPPVFWPKNIGHFNH